MTRRVMCLVMVTGGLSALLLATPAQAARFCVTHDTAPSNPRVSGYTCVDTRDPNLIDCGGSINGNPTYVCT